ncbi:MAG: SLBB domain-containing protein [bacterium]
MIAIYKIFRISLTVILLLFFAIMPAIGQDGESSSDSASSGQTPGEESGQIITFDNSEDASLFVGYYRLNAGDEIYVEVITDKSLAYKPMLDEKGFIALPVIGKVNVLDMTAGEAREAIQNLADIYYVNAWITVKITKIARVKFYLYGDVRRPGFYTVSGATTLFDFLQQFGYTTDFSHRRIVHVRAGPQTALPESIISSEEPPETEMPLNDVIIRSLASYTSGESGDMDPRVAIVDPLSFTLEGKIEQLNFYLEYGDILYVPEPTVTVSLTGFRRSGTYEVLPGETWADILHKAGRPSMSQDISNMVLERRDADGVLSRLFYNLNYLDEPQLAQISLENRDQLSLIGIEGNIYVLGAVEAAGAFPFKSTSIPLDYLTLAGGPKDNAHIKFAVIYRPPRDPSAPLEDGQVWRCNLNEPVSSGRPSAEVELEPGDIIFIPDKGERITTGILFTGLSVLINSIRLFS